MRAKTGRGGIGSCGTIEFHPFMPAPASHAERVLAKKVACVTETVVPVGPDNVSTCAPNCWARALTMLVPNPLFA
jgi:hypothetical protein